MKKMNCYKVSCIFSVLCNPINFSRYDSGFLRFDKYNYEVVREIIQDIYEEYKSYFQHQVPLFTKKIAPGVGLAEKPIHAYRYMDDFGINRCEIVADALLEANDNNDESPEARMQYIAQHFERLEIDLEHPYLNPGSEDIYTPLNIA